MVTFHMIFCGYWTKRIHSGFKEADTNLSEAITVPHAETWLDQGKTTQDPGRTKGGTSKHGDKNN